MIDKITDANFIDTSMILCDDSTLNTSISYFPYNYKICNRVNIEPLQIKFAGKNSANISIPPICWINHSYIL